MQLVVVKNVLVPPPPASQTKTMVAIRDHIQNEITAITPIDGQEEEHIADGLAWIKSDADLFRIEKPDKPPKHLVSYFVVVDPDKESILLVDHVKAQLWLPTGGHVEPNEDPAETVRREAQEELAMQAVFLKNRPHPFFITVNQTGGLTPGHTDVSLWYLIRGNVHDFIDFDRREFNDVEWFTFDEILQSDPVIFDRHMHRFTRKLVAYLR